MAVKNPLPRASKDWSIIEGAGRFDIKIFKKLIDKMAIATRRLEDSREQRAKEERQKEAVEEEDRVKREATKFDNEKANDKKRQIDHGEKGIF